jgi:hypothetical protein
LKVRGYSGRLSGGIRDGKTGANDLTVVAIGVLIFGAAIAVKTYGELSWYEAYLPAVSFVILIVSAAFAYISETRGIAWKR